MDPMSTRSSTRTVGSFLSNPIRLALFLATIGFVGIVLIGCQSTKNNCASCPFSRDKAEIDDIEQRGQEALTTSTNSDASEPAAPNVSQSVEPLDRGLFGTRLFRRSKTRATSPTQVESEATTESSLPAVATTSEPAQSVASAETPIATQAPETFDSPTQSEALASASIALNQHFPNTAADVKEEDPVAIPEAPVTTLESSQDASATTTPQYQSVAPSNSPAPAQELGFAPSELDHSAAPVESTQAAQSAGPVLSDVSSPKEETQSAPVEFPETPEATPSPAPVQEKAAPAEGLQAASTVPVALPDQTSLQATFATKQPVSLKTSTTPRYVYNTASTSKSTRSTVIGAPRARAANASVNARSTVRVGETSRFVPNGQTSKIIPGMELGVIDLSSQSK